MEQILERARQAVEFPHDHDVVFAHVLDRGVKPGPVPAAAGGVLLEGLRDAAFAIERQAALTDLAIDMFDKLIGAAHRRAEAVRRTRQLDRADAMEAFARNHLALCRALIAARENDRPLGGAIERTIGWNRLSSDAEAIERALGRGEGGGLDELIGRRLALRRAARMIFDAFTLRSFKPNDPILQAVELLRSLYAGERSRLPSKVPIVFLKPNLNSVWWISADFPVQAFDFIDAGFRAVLRCGAK